MPEIPTLETTRRPSPRFGGTPFKANPLVTPGEVYEGRGLQRLGAEVADFFVKEQLKADRNELEHRTTQYKAEVLTLQADWQQHKSSDVAEDTEFFTRYTQKHDELKAKILGDASNHRVSQSLEQRLALGDINVKEGLISHINKERAVFNTQVYKSSITVAQATAASNPYNASTLQLEADKIVIETAKYADENGMPQVAKQALVQQNLTKLHAGVIAKRIDDKRFGMAETYYKEHYNEILPDARSNIEKALEDAGTESRTQKLSDYTFTRFKDDEKAGLAYIRDNAETGDRDEALARLKNRYTEQERQKTQGENDAYDNGIAKYMQGIENGLTPQQAYDAVDKKGMKGLHKANLHNRMQADVRGAEQFTDPDVFLDLYEMATGTPEQKARFRNKDVTNLRDYQLSTQHTIYFAKLQDDIDAQIIASTTSDLVTEIASSAGYVDKKTGKKKDASGIINVKERFDAELLSLQEATGKKATPVQEREIADRLSLEYMREGRFWGTDRVPVIEGEIEGVPTDLIDDLVYRLTVTKQEIAKEQGTEPEPVTEAEIKSYYQYLQQAPTSRTDVRRRGSSSTPSADQLFTDTFTPKGIVPYPDTGGHF